MKNLAFTKMHGLGNDYVYMNCLEKDIDNAPEVARFVSDRHFGIGADGLVLIKPSSRGTARMQMFNADGSEAEMCGNAIRCVAKFLHDEGITAESRVVIETLAGDLPIDIIIENGSAVGARVNMGRPRLNGPDIPVAIQKNPVISEPISLTDIDDPRAEGLQFTAVSMGNPHAVFFTEQVTDYQIHTLGPRLELHKLFPNRINVEFARVLNRGEIEMRVWERGSGETLACGTGACATAVAAHLNGLTDRSVQLHLLGGTLHIEVTEETVFMTGPATRVFDGVVHIPSL
ncbi:diaminopimelate epimerase [Spirochaeta dissipatitropha]